MNKAAPGNQKQSGLSLVNQLVLGVVAIALILGGLETFAIYRSSQQSLLDSYENGLLSTVKKQTDELERIFLDSQNSAKSLATQELAISFLSEPQHVGSSSGITAAASGSPDTLPNLDAERKAVEIMLGRYDLGGNYPGIYLLNTSGNVVASTDGTLLGKNFGSADYFQKAAAGDSWIDVSSGEFSAAPDYYFSEPVQSSAGQIVGVAVMKLSYNVVNGAVNDRTVQQILNSNLMFADQNGVILYSDKPERLFKTFGPIGNAEKSALLSKHKFPVTDIQSLQLAPIQEGIASYSKPAILSFFDADEKSDVIVALVKTDNFRFFFAVESVKAVIVAGASREAGLLALYAILAAGIAAIAMVLFVSTSTSPLRKLIHLTEEYGEGNFAQRIEPKGSREFKLLATSFNTMASRIFDLYSLQEVKINEKTRQLSESVVSLALQNKALENVKAAMLNILEDFNVEQRDLIKQRKWIENIINSVGDAVFAVDSSYRISLMNPFSAYLTGYESQISLGKYYGDIFKLKLKENDETMIANIVEEVMKSGVTRDVGEGAVLLRKSGPALPVSVTVAPMKDATGKVFGATVVFRDMRKERELEQAKNDFLSIAAHQLRTPLGSMRWSIELLSNGDVGDLPSPALEILSQMHQNNKRLIDLVNRLLDVSRIDQGRVKNEPKTVDILTIVTGVYAEMNPEAAGKNISIQIDVTDKQQLRGMADPQLLHEIIQNLVANSIKYTPSGGKVIISGESSAPYVILTISDNGMGITKSDQEKIFSKFFRAKNAVLSETGGTGLGLFVVKSYVESWGGSVWFKSEEGKGSTFYVKIPAAS
jgi:PAS domain S-box-containing protein